MSPTYVCLVTYALFQVTVYIDWFVKVCFLTMAEQGTSQRKITLQSSAFSHWLKPYLAIDETRLADTG